MTLWQQKSAGYSLDTRLINRPKSCSFEAGDWTANIVPGFLSIIISRSIGTDQVLR